MGKWSAKHSHTILSLPYYYYYFVFIWIARSLDHHFGWELHFVVFGPLSPYVVFSWSFFIVFAILLAVSLRSVWSLQNISVLFTFGCVVCMDSFTFIKYMFLCFSWFVAFTAGYVVVFTSVVVFYGLASLFLP